MNTKTLLRVMALLAAAGGAVTFLMPFLQKAPEEPPTKSRRTARRRTGVAAVPATKSDAEKPARSRAKTRRTGNGGSPSHH